MSLSLPGTQLQPAQKAKGLLTCDQQQHPDSRWHGLLSAPGVFLVSQFQGHVTCLFSLMHLLILNTQLELLDFSLVPNAWIRTGIETLGRTPVVLFLVVQPYSQVSSLYARPPSGLPCSWCSYWFHCALSSWSHTRWVPVSQAAFPRLHWYHHELVKPACTAAQTTDRMAKAPAVWGQTVSHDQHA